MTKPLAIVIAMTGTISALLGSRFYLTSLYRQHHGLYPDFLRGMLFYQRAALVPNYFDLGFVRRGLAGTIGKIVTTDPLLMGVWFHGLSLLCLVAVIGAIVYRLGQVIPITQTSYMAAVFAISPQTFSGWSLDLPRSDMLVVACIGMAVLAFTSGRRTIALMIVLASSLVHETSVIFGLPILGCLCFRELKIGLMRLSDCVAFALVCVLVLASIAIFQHLYAPSNGRVLALMVMDVPADNILAQSEDQSAAYWLVSGFRGIKAAVCYNVYVNTHYFYTIFFITILLTLYTYIVGIRSQLLFSAMASFFPTIFMVLIATDQGRWLRFGVANLWLLGASLRLTDTGVRRADLPVLPGSVLMAVLLSMGPTTVLDASYGVNSLLARLGVADPPSAVQGLDRCDPDWRSVLRTP